MKGLKFYTFRAIGITFISLFSYAAHADGWSNPGTFKAIVCDTVICTINGFTGLNSATNNYCGSNGYYLQLPAESTTNFKQMMSMLLMAQSTHTPIALYTTSCINGRPLIGAVSSNGSP